MQEKYIVLNAIAYKKPPETLNEAKQFFIKKLYLNTNEISSFEAYDIENSIDASAANPAGAGSILRLKDKTTFSLKETPEQIYKLIMTNE